MSVELKKAKSLAEVEEPVVLGLWLHSHDPSSTLVYLGTPDACVKVPEILSVIPPHLPA